MNLLRWQVIGGLDIALEVMLLAMTVALVWNLQAPIRTKAQVVLAFSFRLPYVDPRCRELIAQY